MFKIVFRYSSLYPKQLSLFCLLRLISANFAKTLVWKTWIWRQMMMSKTTHTKYKWHHMYASEWNHPRKFSACATACANGNLVSLCTWAGVCGSDFHYMRGEMGKFNVKPDGVIMGHEFSGTVVEVGKNAQKNFSVRVHQPICAKPYDSAKTCLVGLKPNGQFKYCLQNSSYFELISLNILSMITDIVFQIIIYEPFFLYRTTIADRMHTSSCAIFVGIYCYRSGPKLA